MKFANFLNEKLNDAFATNVEIDVDYIDEDADEDEAVNTIRNFLRELHDLGVDFNGSKDTGGSRSYSKISVDTDKIADCRELRIAIDKAIKAVGNKVGVRGEFSYDGEDVEAYYKEDDDYVTASTYVKIK